MSDARKPAGDQGNSSWMSLVADVEVEVPSLSTLDEVIAFRADPSRDLSRHNVDLPANVDVHDVTIRERDGYATTAEICVPKGEGPFPTMLYMHGGGWCWGKAEYVRKLAMSIAARGHVVVNLSYALAPEHPFPYALEESIHAVRWMSANAREWNGAPGPVAIGGASAGANLAAATIVALNAPEPLLPERELAGAEVEFSAALFLYGIFNFPLLMQVPNSHAGGFAETLYNQAYLGPHWLTKHRDPLVSPALADSLERFPPTYLAVGSNDALLPQTLDMTGRLAEAGVPTSASVAAGLDHSYAYIPHKLPDSARELETFLAWLAKRTGADALEVEQ
ncbi:MAG: alpha/beta hydrolase [Solirubrobacterales bacterium]